MLKRISCYVLLLVLASTGCHLVFPFDVARRDASGHDATIDGRGDGTLATDGSSPDAGPVPTRVLTGEASMEGRNGTTTIELGPGKIQLDHAFVLCSFRTMNSNPYHAPTCQLGPAGLTITAGNAASNAFVRWYVVQLAAARVERGNARLEAAEKVKTQKISGVELSKAFVLVTSRADAFETHVDQRRLVAARLLDSTTLELARGEASAAVDVAWQVVQLAGARVQHGTADLVDKAMVTVTIEPVDRSRSFLLFSALAPPETNGREAVYSVRGQLVDGTTIELTRGDTGAAVEVRWFVVELGKGRALHGLGNVSMGSTGTPQKLGGVVDLTRSFPVLSTRTTLDNGSPSLQDDIAVTAFISGPSTISIERTDMDTHVSYAWSVVELPP